MSRKPIPACPKMKGNKMRKGIKTTELALIVLSSFAITIWPDFPIDGLAVMWTAIIGRTAGKLFSDIGSGRLFHKTEFWVMVAFTIAKSVLPDIPDAVFYAVIGYVGGQPLVKIIKQKQERKPSNVQNL